MLDLRIHFKVVPRGSLADFIRQHREAAGLKSQTDLAKRIGVQQQQVSKWESGAALPSVKRIPALAKALKVDAADLYALLAEASQNEAASVKRDRDLLMERLQRFTDRYEELGHTYAANHDLLKVLLEKNEAIMERLNQLEARWLQSQAGGDDPPSGRPGRRRP